MQTRRRPFAVLAALCAATVLFAGCSKDSGGPLPDAKPLVSAATDQTKKLTSAHLVLSINGKIQGLPIKTLTGDLTNTPAVGASGNTTITFGGSDLDANFVVADGELFATLTPNKWTDFGKAADIYDVSAILNPDTGLADLLANFTDYKSDGRESINGQNTIRVTGKVSADAVNKIAAQFKASGPVPATFWIQESGDHQLVQAKLEKSSGNAVQMTVSNWNQPVQITKPQVSS